MDRQGVGSGLEFGPSRHSQLTPDEKTKYEFYYRKLKLFRDQLPSHLTSRLPSHLLKELASSLLDGMVFAIVGELEDIQRLTERSMLKKRMEIVSRHKVKKVQQARQHAKEVSDAESKPHTLPLIRRRHEEEKGDLEKTLEEEMKSVDREIVLELDQLVSDQQSTMQQCALPLFCLTNNPQDVQLQMHLLRFLQKMRAANLAASSSATQDPPS